MHNWRLYSIKTAAVALRRPDGGPQTSSETLSAAGGHCLRGVPRASHDEGLDPGLTRTGGGRSTPSRSLTKLIIEIRVSLRGPEVIARILTWARSVPGGERDSRWAPRLSNPTCRTPTRWKRMLIEWVIVRSFRILLKMWIKGFVINLYFNRIVEYLDLRKIWEFS